MEITKYYKSKLESELNGLCTEIVAILDKNLLKKASTAESKVFYLKMKADYNRYLAEFSQGDKSFLKIQHN
jgi:14-3-3 protein epsilon